MILNFILNNAVRRTVGNEQIKNNVEENGYPRYDKKLKSELGKDLTLVTYLENNSGLSYLKQQKFFYDIPNLEKVDEFKFHSVTGYGENSLDCVRQNYTSLKKQIAATDANLVVFVRNQHSMFSHLISGYLFKGDL